MKQANPGVPEGVEIVGLATPFGGWAQAPSLAPAVHYTASIEGVQGPLQKQIANNYAESDGITLFHTEKFGHIAPARTFGLVSDAGGGTPHLNQLALNGAVENTNQLGIVVLENGRLVSLSANSGASTVAVLDVVYGASAGAGINHSGHTAVSNTNADMIVMKDLGATQKEWAINSWEDNTDADINICLAKDFTGQVTGWYSAIVAAGTNNKNLTKGVPHKMSKGPDGNIYITNGAYVEQVVVNAALDAAVTGLRLPLGAGWTASSILSYRNYVAILAYSGGTGGTARGDTAVFLWNGQTSTVNGVTSTAPQFIYPIPDNVGQGIFFDGEILYAVTSGRNLTSKLFEFTKGGFKQVFESAFVTPGNTSLQGAMESYQASLMIGGIKNSSEAHLYRFYGRGFHDEGRITDGTNQATQVGMIKNLFGGTLFTGIKYGSTYAITSSNIGTEGYQLNSQLRTILYTEGILGRRLYPLGFKGSVNRIQLYLSQFGTGASIYLSLFKDYTASNPGGTADLLNVLIDTNTAVANGDITGTNFFGGTTYRHYAYPVGTTEIDISDISIPDLSTFYMVITFSHSAVTNQAAIIRRLVAFWAPSQ